MRNEYLVFGRPLIEQAEIDEVVDSMKSAWLGTGPKVGKFEEQFSAYKGGIYVAAVNSCTAALHLSCLTLGLDSDDEVIVPAVTFCATANAVIHAGATPVLADIDPVTLNIAPEALKKRITPKTRAVIVVHFAGRPCDMDAIMAIAHEHDLAVIEDCAHAIETEYHGEGAGTIGDFGCFSFYATKNVVTGEGGMVVSSDESRIARIKIMALHGLSCDAWRRFSDSGYKHYYVEEAGFKYNMMDLQAAIGIHQLERVEKNWVRRQAIWDRYMNDLPFNALGLPAPVEPQTKHAYHLFTIRVKQERSGISRDALLTRLHEERIGTGVHYLCLAEHPYYQKQFNWNPADYPHATTYGRETVSLPLSPGMTEMDIEDVITAVKRIVKAR